MMASYRLALSGPEARAIRPSYWPTAVRVTSGCTLTSPAVRFANVATLKEALWAAAALVLRLKLPVCSTQCVGSSWLLLAALAAKLSLNGKVVEGAVTGLTE